MADLSEETLIKRGEECIRANIRRSKAGIIFTVWALPHVEDFMRSFGGGDTLSVREFSRNWIPVGGKDLTVYELAQDPGNVSYPDGLYNLGMVGNQEIYSDGRIDGSGRNIVNLAPLRLVGISEGTGVSFELRGAFSLDKLKLINRKFIEASRHFYASYMLPIDLTAKIVTQEAKL